MPKARALVRFFDLKDEVMRAEGETFEASKKRLDEINSTRYGKLAAFVGGAKDAEAEAKAAAEAAEAEAAAAAAAAEAEAKAAAE